MLGSTDYIGIAAVIAAVFSGIAAVLTAWVGRTTRETAAKIDTNGDPRTLGQIATDVGAQIAPHDAPTSTQVPVEGE